MTKAKIGGTALILALALGGLSASSASAGEWFVNGSKLAAGAKESLASTLRMAKPVVFNIPAENIKFTCAGSSRKSPEIIGTTTGKAESLIFEACSEISPVNCSVEATIPTEPVQGDPFFNSVKSNQVLFTPQTGTTFATVNFLGTNCAVAGEKPAKGKIVAAVPTNQTELTEQPIEGLGSIENNSFEIAGHKAYVEGGEGFGKLSSGKRWAFKE